MLGPADLSARRQQRRRRLEEDQRLGGNFIAQFGGVLAIVAADANDLRRINRREQRGLRQRKMVHAAGGNVFEVSTCILR